MNQLVLVAKALSDSNRIRVLSVLRHGELCVCEIADALQMPQSSLSSHLQCLRAAGLVSASKKGTWAYYRLTIEASALLDSLALHFCDLDGEAAREDQFRLEERMKMREKGCCVIGYGQLVRIGETKRT